MKENHEVISHILGFFGSAFSALCCIGFSVLVGTLASIGAGFLVNDQFLIPLLILSLSISLIGFLSAFKKRRNPWTLGMGIMSSILILASVFAVSKLGVYIGLTTLFLSSLWNLWEGFHQHHRLKRLHQSVK